MNSDSAFYIGTKHEVCEDYALHAPDHILVSDGCSSSPQTDCGARIVCLTASKYQTYKMPRAALAPLATKMGQLIGASEDSLDVTLLSGHFNNDGNFAIQMFGDGNIVFETKSGIMYVISANYKRSAPYYVSYLHDVENDKLWSNISGNSYEVKLIIIDGENIRTYKTDEKYSFNKDLIPSQDFSFSPKGNRLILDPSSIRWAALSSDGLEAFYEYIVTDTSKYLKPIPFLDVVQEFFKIRNTKGSFVQRRMNMFRKACERKGWYNGDDISVAIMSME